MDRAGRSILVVDDEPTIREFVTVFLEGEGFEVCEAWNGRDALDMLECWQPDLIILDMRMPVLDGAAFLQCQKANPRLSQVPVIVMSASLKRQQSWGEVSANALLPKPFAIDDLLAHVEALVRAPDLVPA